VCFGFLDTSVTAKWLYESNLYGSEVMEALIVYTKMLNASKFQKNLKGKENKISRRRRR